MSVNKNQKKRDLIDNAITFSLLGLMVAIMVGYYFHTHPSFDSNVENTPEKIENVSKDVKEPLKETKDSVQAQNDRNLQKL